MMGTGRGCREELVRGAGSLRETPKSEEESEGSSRGSERDCKERMVGWPSALGTRPRPALESLFSSLPLLVGEGRALRKWSDEVRVSPSAYREVFKAKHRLTGQKVALKKVLMENEKEGVSVGQVAGGRLSWAREFAPWCFWHSRVEPELLYRSAGISIVQGI